MTHHVNSTHFAGSVFMGEGVYETLPQRASASPAWQNRNPHPDLIRELIIACAMSKESDRTVGRALMALAGILLEDGDTP